MWRYGRAELTCISMNGPQRGEVIAGLPVTPDLVFPSGRWTEGGILS